MITKIEIENYKSIDKLDFEIGRFNVFIGENGCGKTNILEAIAFAASANDLGLLSLKGVRVTEPKYFRSGFETEIANENITLSFFDSENNNLKIILYNSNDAYSKWDAELIFNNENIRQGVEKITKNEQSITNELNSLKYEVTTLKNELKTYDNIPIEDQIAENIKKKIDNVEERTSIHLKMLQNNLLQANMYLNSLTYHQVYVLYAPENSYLRNYNIDTPYAQPLGTKGEGLLKLIKVIKEEKPEEYKEIIEHLHLIDWFADIEISEDSISGTGFQIKDAYLEEGIGGFDIRNANEGFLLLLFYITLFVSDYTPSFFAIDNIDTALNPKLCTKLIEVLAGLAKKHNKQVLITTHNPAILDGINLNDDEQRLFAVSRNKLGFTRVTRIEKKAPLNGEKSVKLSEQFIRGYIGGLPKNF